MIQVVIIILFIIFLIYSIRCLNRSETYTIKKLYISWENKNYVEESVNKWILVLVNSDGDELHKIENIDVSNRKNFESVKITFIDDKDFDGKIFGDNKLKVYYNKKIDSNIVITTNIRFDGTDFSAKLSDIEYADSNLPDKFIDPKINTARYVWYGSENSTTSYNDKLLPIQTIAVYSDGENITKDLTNDSIGHSRIEPVYGSDGEFRKVFKDSSARDNRTSLQNATWIKSSYDTIYDNGSYTGWIRIDLGKEYPIDKVVVDRGDPAQAYDNWKINDNWEDTFVKLISQSNIEVSRSTDKVPTGQQATDYKEEGLTKGIKTFTFPFKTAKVDCIGVGGTWSTCSQTCGPNGKQMNSFKKLVPARNGGSCPSASEERPCNRKLCEYNKMTSANNFEYIRYSPQKKFIFSSAKSKIEESEYALTKTSVYDFRNLNSATYGTGSTQNYVHYWRIKYTYPDSVIEDTWDPGRIKVKGEYSVTIETDSYDNQGYVLVNNTFLGSVSSKGTIGGGTFKGGNHSKYDRWNAQENRYENPHVYIDIFFYHKKDEPTNNDVRILFKGPGMNSSTYDFTAFRSLMPNPPKHSSDFNPLPPEPEEESSSSPCDKIDRTKRFISEMVYQDCLNVMDSPIGEDLKNDPEFFDMIFGPFLK